MSNCRNPYPAIIIQNRIYRQTTGTTQVNHPKETQVCHIQQDNSTFSSIRQILFYPKNKLWQPKDYPDYPSLYIFLQPGAEVHLLLMRTASLNVTHFRKSPKPTNHSSATSLEMECPVPKKKPQTKSVLFQIKCRKYTIIHKCQHPIKSFLQV